MITLQEVNNFNNFTNPRKSSQTQYQRSIVSPRGNFLLRHISYEDQRPKIILFNLTDYSQIPINININETAVLKPTFTLDQSQIIFTNTKGIFSYSLQNKSLSYIIAYSQNNRISDFEFNPSFTILYYINSSQLSSINYMDNTSLISSSNARQTNCNPGRLKYDFNTDTIVTSTIEPQACLICKWNVQDGSWVSIDGTTLKICFLNEMYIFQDQLVITKKIFNNENFGSSIILNLTNLDLILTTDKNTDYHRPGFITRYHNYYIEYFSLSTSIFMYRNNFSMSISNNMNISSFQYVKSIAYNPFKQQLYIVGQAFDDVVTTVKPLFNCSQLKGTISNQTQIDCSCAKGFLFNKQAFACQRPACHQLSSCQCPRGQNFNNFNLKCEVDCQNISNAYPLKPYGSPLRCICQPQFTWGRNSMNCFVPKAEFSLEESNSGGSPAGVIIVIVIIILLLIAAGFLYYYKKCRNQQPRQEGQNNQNEAADTDRVIPVVQRPRNVPSIQSNQHLRSREQRIEEPHQQGRKTSILKTEAEDLQNFSIDEQDEEGDKQNYLSEIESNIENPLA